MTTVQVYEGDGISEEERLAQALLEAERQALLAMQVRPRTLKMKWTKEAMEDLKAVHSLDLDQVLQDFEKDMGVPNELLTATK
jgi:hypothetical protein